MTRFRPPDPRRCSDRLACVAPTGSVLSLLATWNKRHDRLFAGLGPNTDEELAAAGQGRARYGFESLGAELLWSRRLPGRLVARLHGGLDRRDYRSTDVIGGPSVASSSAFPPTPARRAASRTPASTRHRCPAFTGVCASRARAGAGPRSARPGA